MPSVKAPRRIRISPPLLGLVGLGFAYGALGYGVPIAVLHVLHNHLRAPIEAVVLGAELALLYGAAAGALMAVVGGPLLWLRGSPAGGKVGEGVLPGDPFAPLAPRLAGAPLRLGLFLFGLAFWVPFFLWGLTYDQTGGLTLQGAGGMAAFLGGAAVVIAVGVGVLTWLLDHGVRLGEETRRLGAVLALATVVAVLALVLASRSVSPAPSAVTSRSSAPRAGGEPPGAADGVVVDAAATKVALVALDGLDPQVVDRLVGEGALPTFERLRREGVYGEIETLPDANSAVLWASIYSGLSPERHGVLDFYRIHLPGISTGLYPVHRTFFKEAAGLLGRVGLSRRVAISRRDLVAPPVWEIADWAGLTIGVVDGYLYSFPAHAPRTEGGYFLANAFEVFAGGLATGESRGEDLGLYVQPDDVLVHTELPVGEDFEWQAQATLDLLRARPQPRLLSFYSHQPDSVQHQHWRGFEPWRYFGAADDVDAMGGPITEMHRRFDAFLAELLEVLEPDTVLLVVSDHGHSPTLVHSMDTQHRHGPPGVFLFYGGPVREGYRYSPRPTHVYDVMPTVLYLLGLPVPHDLAGRVLEEVLDPDLPRARPIRHIDSYRRRVPASQPAGARDARANEAEMEKLRRLGYVW